MRFLRQIPRPRPGNMHLGSYAGRLHMLQDSQDSAEMVPSVDDPRILVPADSPTAPAQRTVSGRPPQRLILFDRRAIRDTATYLSEENPGALSLPGMAAWGFDIENLTNQTLTWNIIGGSYSTPSTMANVGASGTIATNTQEPIATDLFLYYLSLSIAFTVAPTIGVVNVKAWADPR